MTRAEVSLAASRRPVQVGIAVLLALLLVGAGLIRLYVDRERDRDLLEWETRLGLIADAKADSIARLLAAGLRDLDELAGNASLQLYLWQFTSARVGGAVDAESAPQAYLRNLIIAAAERSGYLDRDSVTVPANLASVRSSGLALVDRDGAPVAATPGLADLRSVYGDIVRNLMSGDDARATRLALDGAGQPVLIQVVRVRPVSGAASSDGAIGAVVGIRSASQTLFPLLARGPALVEDNETLLVERRQDELVILSPTGDGAPPMRRTLPVDRAGLAEPAAVDAPRDFAVRPNYRGRPVLQSGRAVRGQPWLVLQQVDADQALSQTNTRRRFLIAVLSLGLLAIGALAVAAWRHGRSVQAQRQVVEFREQAAKLRRQTELLHTVTDNTESLTVLTTRDRQVVFLNRAAAEAFARPIPEALGSSLEALMPADAAAELRRCIDATRAAGGAAHDVLQLKLASGERTFQATFVPVPSIGERRDLVLTVLTDVTDLENLQREHAAQLRNVIASLVRAVDARDPHAAQHATRTAEVATAVADAMALDDEQRRALEMAATLANVGKIMIPRELLMKVEPLTTEEWNMVRRHVQYGIDLLRSAHADTPVVEIISQKQEQVDGRGYPDGLTGEQMSDAGKILAVANAFVALVSNRAYRKGVSVRAALDELLQHSGSQFDRRVIAALFHVAENRRDWNDWR